MLNIQTISVSTTPVAVELGKDQGKVLIKNFGEGDIWVSTSQEATKTEGSARIPANTAQVLVKHKYDTLYVVADADMADAVEIQPVG